MSDEPLVNLEDEAPAAETPAQPVEATAPPAEAPAPEPEDELDTIELQGQRVVPVNVLRAMREEQKALKAQAAKAADLEAQVRELAPYAEFIKHNQQLLRQPQAPPEAPKAPDADPDALEAAALMDFYTPDGSLDAAKGAKWLALQDKRASKLADQRVQPILQRTAQEQAQINFQKAAQIKDANGESPSMESLRAVWDGLSDQPHLLADPRVAGVMSALALGIDRLQKPRAKTVPTPPPAIVSEPSGGLPQNRPSLSNFERQVAKERGISETKWAENLKHFTPGRASALED